MSRRNALFPVLTALILAPFLLSPNPFGTLLLGVGDEEIFVRTALSALEHATVPGLDFADAFRAPYGALQAYVVYTALLPAFLWHWLVLGSASAAVTFLTAHTGALIQIVRWINGIAGLSLFALAAAISMRSETLKRKMWLLSILLLSNSIFLSMAHTGKMWFIQTIAELVAGILVIFVEEMRVSGREVPRWYVPALVWCTVAALSQSFMGAGAALWISYAIYLRHVSPQEVLAYIRAEAAKILIVFLAQASILYEGYRVSMHLGASLSDVTGVAGSVPFLEKLTWPVIVIASAAPLALGAWVVALSQARSTLRSRTYHVALAHPLIVFSAYFVVFGFPHTLRYLLPLSGALALSAALAMQVRRLSSRLLAALSLVALTIAASVSLLWWTPSAEMRTIAVLRDLPGLRARDSTLFVEPEQLFPLAGHSTANLLRTRAVIARHGGDADAESYETRWERLYALDVVYLGEYEIGAHVVLGPPAEHGALTYSVTDDCAQRCRPLEACIAINEAMCRISPAYEDAIVTIPGLLRSGMLGGAYFIRKL